MVIVNITRASVSTHLCCGRGCRCWNLRSRWRSAPREGCSSPSHRRNTITMATAEAKRDREKRVWERVRARLLSYFKLSYFWNCIISKSKSLWYHNTPLNAQLISNRWLHTHWTHTWICTLNSQPHAIHIRELSKRRLFFIWFCKTSSMEGWC